MAVGIVVGFAEGAAVVGFALGTIVGLAEGAAVGLVGFAVGAEVGPPVYSHAQNRE